MPRPGPPPHGRDRRRFGRRRVRRRIALPRFPAASFRSTVETAGAVRGGEPQTNREAFQHRSRQIQGVHVMGAAFGQHQPPQFIGRQRMYDERFALGSFPNQRTNLFGDKDLRSPLQPVNMVLARWCRNGSNNSGFSWSVKEFAPLAEGAAREQGQAIRPREVCDLSVSRSNEAKRVVCCDSRTDQASGHAASIGRRSVGIGGTTKGLAIGEKRGHHCATEPTRPQWIHIRCI